MVALRPEAGRNVGLVERLAETCFRKCLDEHGETQVSSAVLARRDKRAVGGVPP